MTMFAIKVRALGVREIARTLMSLVLASLLLLRAAAAAPGEGPSAQPPNEVIIFMKDCSDSMAHFPIPETLQAAMINVMDLADLSPTPPQVAVVFFGGSGVTVVGDDNGLPTAAIGNLRQKLLRDWPVNSGLTPLDLAAAEVVRIVGQLPDETHITVLLMADGQPDSGLLRPADFPQIETAIQKLQEKVINQNADAPEAFQQQLLSRLITELSDRETETFLSLYEQQRELEFEATLAFARQLNERHVRFVTISFGQIPELNEIHEAAGGAKEDLVTTLPNEVIGKLNDLHLLQMPRVVQLPTVELAATPGSFERSTRAPLEAIGEAAVVTLEFHPALALNDQNGKLEAQVGASVYVFSLDGSTPEAVFVRDAQGNVATATLLLEHVDPGDECALRWRSPDASVSAPACTLFTSMRLREDLIVDLRPTLSTGDGPFLVTPQFKNSWQCELRVGDEQSPYPLAGLEGVLLEQRSRQASRCPFQADQEHVGRFVTSDLSIPIGSYDVELHFQLKSGADFHLLLPGWIISEARAEQVTLEITQPGEGVECASAQRDHISFGPVGDSSTEATVLVVLRSEVDYPLNVRPIVHVVDSNDVQPQQHWIQPHRENLVLAPGKVVPLRLKLKLPEELEPGLVDGLFTGELQLLKAETGEALEILPFQEVSGADPELINHVSFELTRPRFEISLPYALHDWLGEHQGELATTVRVSIGPGLKRTMTVDVQHDSAIPRSVTVLPDGLITDAKGQSVPSLRLVPVGTETTQEIAPGQTGRFQLQFEADADCPVTAATTGLRLTGPGLVPAHISVGIQQNDPQIAGWIAAILVILAVIAAYLALRSMKQRYVFARFRTDQETVVTPEQPFPGLLKLEQKHRRAEIVFDADCRVRAPEQKRPRALPSGGRLAVPVKGDTLVLQPGHDADEPVLQLQSTGVGRDVDIEALVTVTEGNQADRTYARAGRHLLMALGSISMCLTLLWKLDQPAVVTSLQWLYDAIVPL